MADLEFFLTSSFTKVLTGFINIPSATEHWHKSLIVFCVSATKSEVAQSNWQHGYYACARTSFIQEFPMRQHAA